MGDGVRFIKESVIKAPPERVFGFHELPDALERLMPPWETAKIIQAAPNLEPGSRAIIETSLFGPIKTRWTAEHTVYDPPRMFEDVQLSGPFKSWRHRHLISPHPDGSILRDEIEFDLPLGPLGAFVAPLAVLPRLEKLFEYRHRVTREWCEQSF